MENLSENCLPVKQKKREKKKTTKKNHNKTHQQHTHTKKDFLMSLSLYYTRSLFYSSFGICSHSFFLVFRASPSSLNLVDLIGILSHLLSHSCQERLVLARMAMHERKGLF